MTYQWQVSALDSDANYSNIGGGTTDPYATTTANLTPSGRWYKAVLNAAGASQQTTTANRGYLSLTIPATHGDRSAAMQILQTGLTIVAAGVIIVLVLLSWLQAGPGAGVVAAGIGIVALAFIINLLNAL